MTTNEDMHPAPVKPQITIDDVSKLDVRVGTIIAVSEVSGSRKLMKLTVDFGDHQRSILSGIRQERDDPLEITGKQAMFVLNLAPREMAGERSEGMLFDIGYEDGIKPALCQPEWPMPNGARAG